MTNPTDYIFTLSIGAYLIVTLALAIDMFFIPRKLGMEIPTPPMRIAGCTVLADFLSLLFGNVLTNILPNVSCFSHIAFFFDGLMIVLACLTGFSLLRGTYPSLRTMLSITIPPILLALIGIFVFHNIYITIILCDIFFIGTYIYLGEKIYVHDRRLADNYADLDNRYAYWFAIYGPFLFIACVAYFCYCMFAKESKWIGIGFNAIMIATHIFICRKILYYETSILVDPTEEESTKEKEPGEKGPSPLSEELGQQLAKELKRLMEEEHLYHKPDLTTGALIEALHTNSNYFFRLMREVLHTRFYDYVNNYRLEEAKHYLLHTNYTQEAIAQEVGFGSDHTLRSVFKKAYGTSPMAWANEQKRLARAAARAEEEKAAKEKADKD